MSQPAFRFRHPLRVRWAEVDPQGVVFNSRYLEYADVAITEYWRAVDFRAGHDDPLEFHVARATVNYRRPIRADEMITLHARTARLGNSSMTILIEIHGPASDDLRAEIELIYVHVDLATGAPMPLPDYLRTAFTAYDAGTE